MGLIFICAASLFVAVGTYVLSSAFQSDPAFMNLVSYKYSKIVLVAIGLILNFMGSAFWILGRRSLASYLLAWTFYLGLLVLFGALIAAWIEQESISLYQIIGLLLLAFALTLLKA